MPPKANFDPTAVAYVCMKVVGEEAPAPAACSAKFGPFGIPPKKVGEDIMKATKGFKGMKIAVEVKVQNKQVEVRVCDTASVLILKALKTPPRDRKKVKMVTHTGKLTMDQVCEIAKIMRPKSYAAEFVGTVKEILGTCLSVGCNVEGQSPKDIQKKIDAGQIEVNE